jgi:hypothetical protein
MDISAVLALVSVSHRLPLVDGGDAFGCFRLGYYGTAMTLPAFPKPGQLPKRREPNPKVLPDGRLFFIKPSKSWTAQKRKVWERDGRRCVFCHKSVNFDSGPEWSRAEIDHIRTQGARGGDQESNLRTTCSGPQGCHAKRHAGVLNG